MARNVLKCHAVVFINGIMRVEDERVMKSVALHLLGLGQRPIKLVLIIFFIAFIQCFMVSTGIAAPSAPTGLGEALKRNADTPGCNQLKLFNY